MPDPVIANEIAILMLLFVASLGAILFKRLHFPYTAGLVIVGLGLGLWVQSVPLSSDLNRLVLSPNAILFIFIPPLVFESALSLNSRLLLRNLLTILLLAGPGLLLSAAIAGSVVAWLTPLSLSTALLFGALISATDPVAVIALLKELGVPERLMMLLEGESLFNDASAIVLFELVRAAAMSGEIGWTAIAHGTATFFYEFTGGVVVGSITALVMICLIALAKGNPAIQATVSTLIAYATFLLAQRYANVSGVIAVLIAGLIVAGYTSHWLKPEVRNYLRQFWSYIAFLANSFVFLLVGSTTASFLVHLGEQDRILWPAIGIAIAAALLARGATIFSLIPALNCLPKLTPTVDWRAQTALFWGGLRGAIALALALSLDENIPGRESILAMTLGVSLFTILVSGATMSQVLKRLQLDRPSLLEQVEQAQARIVAKQQGLEQLDRLATMAEFSPETISALKQQYETALRDAEQSLSQLWRKAKVGNEGTQQVLLWLQAINMEQRVYWTLYNQGLISEPVLEKLALAISLKRDAVLDGEVPSRHHHPEHLETRIERFLVKLSNLLAAGIGRLKQQRKISLRFAYERDIAIASAGAQLIEEINRLVGDRAIESSLAETCVFFYQQQKMTALKRIAMMEERYPTFISTLQEHLGQRSALLGEQAAIQQLETEGTITAAVASRVESLLEAEDALSLSSPIHSSSLIKKITDFWKQP